MRERLDKFAGPKVRTTLEAKIASIKSDLLAQKAAYIIEENRQKRLEKTIAKCTVRAPREGIVVYANESSGWSGRTETQIQEGVTLREGQAIFNLPDPERMCVKVKINESKVAKIRQGQRAAIYVDAFPDRPLAGTVAEVTAIPTMSGGPISDVKVYFATVNIDEGFDDLRPGMSAEVVFQLEMKRDVVRVPVKAVMNLGAASVAAVETPGGYEWRRLELGVSAPSFAEVRAGLKPGDKVLTDPRSLLPVPDLDSLPVPAPAVARVETVAAAAAPR
jgi:hypothetical protein